MAVASRIRVVGMVDMGLMAVSVVIVCLWRMAMELLQIMHIAKH